MKQKILFWLDADLTQFCIAYYLQKNLDCELFAVIDITNRPKEFFKEQNLIKFEKIWFYHDNINKNKKPDMDFLKKFEIEKGINLWQLALNERIFYRFNDYHSFSKDEMLSILSQECLFFEEILDSHNFDYFLTKETALHHHHLFYEMVRARKIKTSILNISPLGNRCFLSQEYMKIDFPEKHQFTSQNKTFEEIQEFRKKGALSKQHASYTEKHGSSKIERIKAAIQFLLISNNSNEDTHFTYYGRKKLKVLFNEIRLSIEKKKRKKFLDKNSQYKINQENPFVYFPMHVEPERSTLLAAPFYTNQIEVIRHIAKSIPIDHILLVKEHPSQELREWREISDYKQIIDIPNVRLIHPTVKSDELMKSSSLVISIGGTSAFEAAFFRKPSIIFTELGYQQLSSVIRVKNIEELPKAINEALNIEVSASDLERYVDLIDKNSFDFDQIQFELKYHDFFYFGAHLADVDISIEKMQEFLKNNKVELENVVAEYINKINQSNEQYNSGN